MTRDHRTPITVGIVGTHSTGKSTLAKLLACHLSAAGARTALVSGVVHRAVTLGLPILHQHTASSTTWLMATGIAAEMEAGQNADIVVVDRAIPDAAAYWFAALESRGEHPDIASREYVQALCKLHSLHAYNYLIRTELDASVPLGDGRDTDTIFRSLVDAQLSSVLAELGMPWQTCTYGDAERVVEEVGEAVLRSLL